MSTAPLESSSPPVGPDDVATLRGFHRLITERVGALDDEYLARGRSLGASRLLWEIGQRGDADTLSLRRELGLDSGYLSRLLRRLESDALIQLASDPEDRRVKRVGLTETGRAEVRHLDDASDRLAASLIAELSESQRRQFVDAASTLVRLLTAGMVTIEPEDPASGDARFCIESYFAELDERFSDGFDPEASISADVDELTEPAGLLLVARLRGEPIGCGALKFHADQPTEIKRMWVSPTSRGLGLGRRLLVELEREAAGHGADAVRLETNESLTEAISMYHRNGYTEVDAFNDEPFAHHWFEKKLS